MNKLLELEANQARYHCKISGETADLRVLNGNGQEALHKCYQYHVNLVTRDQSVKAKSWIQKTASLAFQNRKGDPRYLHGIIVDVNQEAAKGEFQLYQITVEPRLSLLKFRKGYRIFQDKTVSDIVKLVFKDAGILDNEFEFHLTKPEPPLEYKVQYGETELAFVERILAKAGIKYHFKHTKTATKIIFTDSSAGITAIPALEYRVRTGNRSDKEVLYSAKVKDDTVITGARTTDYDFLKPRVKIHGTNQQDDPELKGYFMDYQYPGTATTVDEAEKESARRVDVHRSKQMTLKGETDAPSLYTGSHLPIKMHPHKPLNIDWLIVSLEINFNQPSVLEEYDGSSTSPEFITHFDAVPATVAWKPSAASPPRAYEDTVIVTGPKGEEIYCDENGRVKVQFFWDLEAQADEKTSCYIRPTQVWAGDAYGQMMIPRVGQEMLVTYIAGDPDRPILSGGLYHKENVMPYKTPEHKTRTTLKSSTYPEGKGFNELRFEDKKGQEQIFLHASKDMDMLIENDQRVQVKRDANLIVENNQFVSVKNEQHTTVKNSFTTIKADKHVSIKGNHHNKIENKDVLQAGKEIHLKAGKKIVLDCDTDISLKVSGQFIKLDASGVFLQGSSIMVNNGGAPGEGSGASPEAAKPADPAKPDGLG